MVIFVIIYNQVYFFSGKSKQAMIIDRSLNVYFFDF